MKGPRARGLRHPISDFLSDIEPFFNQQAVIYADVGAKDGRRFEAVLDIGLSVHRAVLIEANPKTFARLQETVSAHNHDGAFTCLNLAISDQAGVVRLRDRPDMGGAVSHTSKTLPEADAEPYPDPPFDVEARRFEDLADLFPDGHVSILTIDVAGHETQVLRGCETRLSAHAIDVLYIEVGVTAEDPQRTGVRKVDDLVTAHGYRQFRIYEPAREWIEGSPRLRTCSVAYFSPTLTARYPVAWTRELSRLRGALDACEESVAALTKERNAAHAEAERLAAALKERFKEIALLTQSFETLIEERDALSTGLKPTGSASKDRGKYGILVGVLLIYLLALAAAIPFIL